MENHYHLLLETPKAPTLSRGIKRLNETYAWWFNARHDRVGHLFQGRFKGILVEREAHMLELIRYVVLNPVRCGAVQFAADWSWSNYRATAGLMDAPDWLDVDWTLAQFSQTDRTRAREAYRQFLADARGASYNPWETVAGQIFLGGTEFRTAMQAMIDARVRSREHPRAQRLVAALPLEAIATRVMEAFGIGDEAQLRRKTRGPHRRALVHLASEYCASPTTALATWLGVSVRAIQKLRRASTFDEACDREYRALLEVLRERVERHRETANLREPAAACPG
jgi:hypothetical protein